MKRICCKCGKCYGEKEPLENKAETHGYCDECFEKEMKKIEETQHKEKRKLLAAGSRIDGVQKVKIGDIKI